MKSWLVRIREQRKDIVFGGSLIALGLLSGWGVALFFVLSHESIHLSMLLAPAGFVFIGIVMIFNDGIERSLQIQDEIESFPALIEDDVEDLPARQVQPGNFSPDVPSKKPQLYCQPAQGPFHVPGLDHSADGGGGGRIFLLVA